MKARSTLFKQLILACALLSAACASDHKSKGGDDEEGGAQEEMDAAMPGVVYDDAGNAIGTVDDSGNVIDQAGNVIGTVDDAGNFQAAVDGAVVGSDGGYAFADGEVPYPVNSSGQVMCGSAVCQCSDGIDNDDPKDGLIDTADPECAAAWDNDESSLATGIPGDNRDTSCQDCFFDGNSGSGNDGCYVPTSCITQGNASSGKGSCDTCEQSAKCQNFCQAFAPNGCDCFGCCEIHVAGTIKYLQLGAQCDIAADGTMTGPGCAQCVQNDSCINKCGECELCAGKTSLPSSCFPNTGTPDGGTGTGTPGNDSGTGTGTPGDDSGTTTNPPTPGYTCENGEQMCGAPGMAACPYGDVCSFGCCIRSPILM